MNNNRDHQRAVEDAFAKAGDYGGLARYLQIQEDMRKREESLRRGKTWWQRLFRGKEKL